MSVWAQELQDSHPWISGTRGIRKAGCSRHTQRGHTCASSLQTGVAVTSFHNSCWTTKHVSPPPPSKT